MGQLGLTTLLAVGAIVLFFVMPGARWSARKAALLASAVVVATLVGFIVPRFGANAPAIAAGLLAVIGLFGAIRVVTHSVPVYSALYFILVAVAVAGMLVLMQATFVGTALMIVYGGAILVTYVFVIMLAQQSGGPRDYDRQAREPFWGVLAGFLVLAVIAGRLATADAPMTGVSEATGVGANFGSIQSVGSRLLTQYVVGVQLAALLLLAAMVGAIAVARRRRIPDDQPGAL